MPPLGSSPAPAALVLPCLRPPPLPTAQHPLLPLPPRPLLQVRSAISSHVEVQAIQHLVANGAVLDPAFAAQQVAAAQPADPQAPPPQPPAPAQAPPEQAAPLAEQQPQAQQQAPALPPSTSPEPAAQQALAADEPAAAARPAARGAEAAEPQQQEAEAPPAALPAAAAASLQLPASLPGAPVSGLAAPTAATAAAPADWDHPLPQRLQIGGGAAPVSVAAVAGAHRSPPSVQALLGSPAVWRGAAGGHAELMRAALALQPQDQPAEEALQAVSSVLPVAAGLAAARGSDGGRLEQATLDAILAGARAGALWGWPGGGEQTCGRRKAWHFTDEPALPVF